MIGCGTRETRIGQNWTKGLIRTRGTEDLGSKGRKITRTWTRRFNWKQMTRRSRLSGTGQTKDPVIGTNPGSPNYKEQIRGI